MNRFALATSAGIARVTESALGPYQTAVVRIGFAATWLFFLLRELPHRHELYGPDGPWSFDLAERLIGLNDAFTVLIWSDGRFWFELVYALALLSAALLLVGWRSRTMSVVFMVGVLSLQNRSVFMGDGGDNVLHLMSIYLVFTRCAQVWSLDARRAGRERAARARGERVTDRVGPALWAVFGVVLVVATVAGKLGAGWPGDEAGSGPPRAVVLALNVLSTWVGGQGLIPAVLWGVWAAQAVWWTVGRRARTDQPRILLDVVANIVHNGALLVIMAEACLIYATAGWYKIQGSRWQDGTAVHYPLHLDYFSPWPALADVLTASGTLVMLVTYGTVLVQVAFPFALLNRRAKNVLLALMMFEHAVIAVVLGLPFFSLAMIAADAVFLPTGFLRRLGAGAARLSRRLPVPRPGRAVLPGPRKPENPEPSHVGSPS
ncbi:HTTM domain-containing protein [Streptomyces sp. NPDC000983]|uniref:HTTM domain-containing protein n=1 Tax=Streptomyces sp. NPDC000983 TaxID=3154373 RepID=UPI003323F42F